MTSNSGQNSVHRRSVLCGGGAAMFGMILTSLIGRNKAVSAAAISGSVPEVDRVLVRSVVDSYQIAVAPSSSADNVEIQRFGWALSDQPPTKAIISEFGLSMHVESQRGTEVRNVLVDFGFTQEAARIIDPAWTMNPLGNWYFILAIVIVFTPIIWYITDRIVEPRLGKWGSEPDEELRAELAKADLTQPERRGLRLTGLAALAVVLLYAALSLSSGYVPLIDESKTGPAQLQPFYTGLVAGFFLLFLSAGIAFGIGAGTVRDSKEVVAMMQEGLRTLAPYLVFVFFAAHFVAMFNWSRLGPIFAIDGAVALQKMDVPAPLLLAGVQFVSSFLDLFIGSAAAKWSAMAPVVVPKFMLLGISPEMTTAAYRMGDSYTNIMTPLMSYFPLILAFARRYDTSLGVGSLLALMLPYALSFMGAGLLMTVGWVAFDLPLGPGAQVFYAQPGGN